MQNRIYIFLSVMLKVVSLQLRLPIPKDMGQTASATIMYIISSVSPLFLFLPIFLLIFKHISSKWRSLPPGPRPWPLIGNILQIEKKLHISMTNFAKVHGPLISLRFGTQIVVVGSSPCAATEILKNHDRLLSSRFILKTIPYENRVLERIALVWNPSCNGQWKTLRTLSRTELFSAKAIQSQASLREKKLMEMIEFLTTKRGKVVNLGEIVFATVFNTISNLLFSKDVIGLENEGTAGRLKSLVWELMEIGTTPNIAEFYPILAPFDPQGLKTKSSKCLKEMFRVWEIYIKERRQRPLCNDNDSSKTDFLDVFLANGFDDEQINWLVVELFSAGTDTTTTTIEWAIAELLKNKHVMKKVEEELDRQINKNTIHESQVCELPYLNACIKETLRLHPPVPFLIPRRASENCEVMNYTIPKDAQVLVNVWAIGRDPSAWEDPLLFKPERFLGSNLNLKGLDFEFIPFGSGRRICPGLPLAVKQLPLILAYLIHHCEWSLPNGEDPAKLDMTENFGLTLQKEQPLLVIPKTKL